LRRTFFVRAIWDDEAQVYVSESDIKGLHIETKTLDEFKQVLDDVAVELILTNHVATWSDQILVRLVLQYLE
jgi:hypothetical protein